MTDKPISPEVLREAERLLPCTNEWGRCTAAVDRRMGKAMHSPLCETRYRPAVARALQDREDRIAAASRPITITDEMVLRGAWAPRNEFCKRVGLQPFDPRQKPDINEIEQARLIISAALNGEKKDG